MTAVKRRSSWSAQCRNNNNSEHEIVVPVVEESIVVHYQSSGSTKKYEQFKEELETLVNDYTPIMKREPFEKQIEEHDANRDPSDPLRFIIDEAKVDKLLIITVTAPQDTLRDLAQKVDKFTAYRQREPLKTWINSQIE